MATWCVELTHWKRPWSLERLKWGGEGYDQGWDGWMASPTQWTWVWVNSGSWWWTGRPGLLQSVGFQRVGHDWMTELKWLNGHEFEQLWDRVKYRKAWCAAEHGVTTRLSDWTATTTISFYYFHPFKFHNNGNWLKLTHMRRVDGINFENFSWITNHYMCLVLTSCLSYYLFHEIYKATSKNISLILIHLLCLIV